MDLKKLIGFIQRAVYAAPFLVSLVMFVIIKTVIGYAQLRKARG